MRALPLLLMACTPDAPETLLAVTGRAGEYELQQVQIPELDDPYRMKGSLGNGSVGGYLDQLDDTTLQYRGGGSLAVDFLVQDGVGVPLDADGIALWSYYYTLSQTRLALDVLGHDTSEIFPIDFLRPASGKRELNRKPHHRPCRPPEAGAEVLD